SRESDSSSISLHQAPPYEPSPPSPPLPPPPLVPMPQTRTTTTTTTIQPIHSRASTMSSVDSAGAAPPSSIDRLFGNAFPSRIRAQVKRPPRDVLGTRDPPPRFNHEAQHQREPPSTADPAEAVKIGVIPWNESLDAPYDASSPDELALVAGAKHLG